MEETPPVQILQKLQSGQAQVAWAEFLQAFSPLILQVIRLFERDADPIAACNEHNIAMIFTGRRHFRH